MPVRVLSHAASVVEQLILADFTPHFLLVPTRRTSHVEEPLCFAGDAQYPTPGCRSFREEGADNSMACCSLAHVSYHDKS